MASKPIGPSKVTNAFDMNGYEIFNPFNEVKSGSDVFISTWGLGTTGQMQPIIDQLLAKKARVSLLVGYSKSSHSLDVLLTSMRCYQSYRWHVKALPSFHAKVWLINNDAWVGSANFVRGTITNLMIRTKRTEIQDFASLNWQQGAEISNSTKLEYIPQSKIKMI